MAWECPCGVSNKDSKQKCRACRTPQGMVWTSQGFASPKEAYYFERVTAHKARHADHLGRLVKMIWMAGIVTGGLAGIYLARITISQGLWATKAVLNSWKNLPWTFVSAWPSTKVLIGTGIIVPLLFFLLPRQVRQNTFAFFGHLVFAVIVASLVGTLTYFLGVIASEF